METSRAALSVRFQIAGWLQRRWVQQGMLFVVCFVVLLRTMVPTLYTLDSAELATGVATLGIVHAPGYPLYVIAAHLFTRLPIGDMAFRINLFSAFCLALAIPLTFAFLDNLIQDRSIGLVTALVFGWSFYVWSTGIVTEIYAPQILTLAVCGWVFSAMYRRQYRGWRSSLLAGLVVGIAVAMAPSSIFFIPGAVVVFLLLRIPLKKCLAAALVSLSIFGLCLLYFPIRAAADPVLNMAGEYDARGVFQPVNLQTVEGIGWMLSGSQFKSLFFPDGYLPTASDSLKTLSWFWGNYLGFGFIVGLIGIAVLYRKSRYLFLVWLICFVPYTYFYTAYGAPDRDTMFGPSYLMWAIVLAFGLKWATDAIPPRRKLAVLAVLPLAVLVVNFPLLDESKDTSVRMYAQTLLNGVPANALVFGVWWDIAPMQFLQIADGQRPDVKLFNLFLFDKQRLATYIDELTDSRTANLPVVFVGNAINDLDLVRYVPVPLEINKSLTPPSGTDRNTQIVTGEFLIVKQPAP